MLGNVGSQQSEQTGLVGRVREEFNCLPVENEEFRRISEKRALEALKPKKETVFIEKIPGKILQSRHALPGQQGAFVVCLVLLVFLSPSTNTLLASDEARQRQAAGEQVYAHATERVARPYLRMLPPVPVLAV